MLLEWSLRSVFVTGVVVVVLVLVVPIGPRILFVPVVMPVTIIRVLRILGVLFALISVTFTLLTPFGVAELLKLGVCSLHWLRCFERHWSGFVGTGLVVVLIAVRVLLVSILVGVAPVLGWVLAVLLVCVLRVVGAWLLFLVFHSVTKSRYNPI